MIENIEIEIRGRVQGVGFRYHTRQIARELKINGYVKNMADGSVLVLASGSKENLEKFINWCHFGPRLAVVESVLVTKVMNNEFNDFFVR